MILETALADALYLNWAIPAAALPELPRALRYDLAPGEGGGSFFGFFSLVLFRQVGLHVRGASWLALSYPQANARLYVRDMNGAPAVFLLRQLAPAWVVPIARMVARQPLSGALLDFPGAVAGGLDGARRWKGHAGAGFDFVAHAGASPSGRPTLGSFSDTSAFFRERSRAYWVRSTSLRSAETKHPTADVVPMHVEVVSAAWLESFLPFEPEGSWGAVHSAFLVPEVRLAFLFGAEPELVAPAQAAMAG